ncbi:MAG TPA: hypothetical protein VH188_07340 [Chthoniobacterales bacterium]|nr:hypothetical protein [Chthoniobacterales bacterium]
MPVSGMAASDKIIHLRELLAERFPQTSASADQRLPTGVPLIDTAIRGGLPKSAITELTSPNLSAGSALLTHTLLQEAQRRAFFLALVDGRDSFDPQTAGSSVLRNLLWIRCGGAADAVKAADFLLRDGNFPLVVLDLVLNPPEELRRIPQSNWYRLQRLVEAAPTAFLVLTRQSMISSAQLKLSLDNAWRLSDLEQAEPTTRLRIRVNRIHGAREIIAKAG